MSVVAHSALQASTAPPPLLLPPCWWREYQLIQILSTEKVIFSVFDSKKTHHISNSECVDCVESLQVKKADVVRRYDTT